MKKNIILLTTENARKRENGFCVCVFLGLLVCLFRDQSIMYQALSSDTVT